MRSLTFITSFQVPPLIVYYRAEPYPEEAGPSTSAEKQNELDNKQAAENGEKSELQSEGPKSNNDVPQRYQEL